MSPIDVLAWVAAVCGCLIILALTVVLVISLFKSLKPKSDKTTILGPGSKS